MVATISVEVPARSGEGLSRPLAVLTIAGSDSGGGAGIQADLRTFAAHGLLGTTAVTAVTAQNTLGVLAWEAVSARLVAAQIHAVLDDLPIRSVKTGMLGNQAIIEAVSQSLRARPELPLVIDPVMVATSGDRLLELRAEASLVSNLLPRATVLTPNLQEAAVLSRLPIDSSPEAHAEAISCLAPRAWVIVKGGHRIAQTGETPAIDLVRSPSGSLTRIVSPWLETTSTHGTGCTLSAAIAARLALHGDTDVLASIVAARRYLVGALHSAVPMGQGHGPVDHLFELPQRD